MVGSQALSDDVVAYAARNFPFRGVVVAIGRLDARSSRTEIIAAPGGMHASRADYRDDFRLIAGHTATGQPTPPWHLGTLEGAGAVRSTVNDMLRFLAVHIGADSETLASEARATQAPRCAASEGHRIGLAWLTGPRGNVWHNGGTGGYRSFMGFSPQRRQAVVVLVNAAIDAVDALGAHLLDPEIALPA